MELPYPTFKEFCQCNDYWRLKINKKPRNKKWVKIIYYPFALIILTFLFISLFIIIGSIKSGSAKSYRHSGKYKKVIKEGILWDSIEYHER